MLLSARTCKTESSLKFHGMLASIEKFSISDDDNFYLNTVKTSVYTENWLKILKNCFTYLPCGSTDQKTIYENFS